ncbi:hypothetical protein CDN99_06105 [Roseateles aquatilis]|uniref:DUF599 domain-containing protein n=1 Tax=Roseateles aquatilis TaxID=431061 RepID=A0A246JH19_9BURK|nr:DUF599 domain-containing protein [Roseateles aquatilis]OWQ91937.1 hypothetical protein CDN99_06105 [Roseateles aquatilis]
MQSLRQLLSALPPLDWLALLLYFAAWVGYAQFAKRHAEARGSLLALTNRVRRQWMLQLTYREMRVLDGAVSQALLSSPSFFASTTILIIGGLLAAIGASEKTSALVLELPFTVQTSALVFDLKLGLLTGIFVYAFFRFTWSMRQYTFGALLVASAPEAGQFRELPPSARETFADRAGAVVGMAAEAFNDGLRGYYLAFPVVAWFFSPWVFLVATGGVIYVLYQREFRSEVLDALRP